MSFVKVTTKYQVTIPTILRRKMGVGAGDMLEAKVESEFNKLITAATAQPVAETH